MEVLHINCNYATTRLHSIMIHNLSEIGISNIVFCPIYNQADKDAFHGQADEHIEVCFRKKDRLLYFIKQRKIKTAIMPIVKKEEFDIIHAYTLMTDGNVARKLSKKYRKPYVVAIRDTDVNTFFRLKPYLRPLGVRIMMNADSVFFLSESYRKKVLQKYVPKCLQKSIEVKTHVIPNGIDEYWLKNRYISRDFESIQRSLERKEINVVCVGKINKRKNIPIVQTALEYLRGKGWRTNLDVIGKVEDESELKKIRKDDFTIIYPPTDHNGLLEHYRKADIFVLVSHTETFGLVYAEAMSQGLPVIYTRGQGFDGHFPEGEVGYSVSDGDYIEIAEAIERVCDDYVRIAKNSLERCIQFDWFKICERYRLIYETIVRK